MKIVTAGLSYIDIDAYAGCIAYADLLQLLGDNARAVSTAPLNESITASIRAWDTGLDSYMPRGDDAFILVDVSNIRHLDALVDTARVIEVIDHHPGYEEYWRMRLGRRACIEPVGAACTQIFERWERSGKLCALRPRLAQLLLTGILDDTLNFRSGTTTARDFRAHQLLSRIAKIDEGWTARYFDECQASMENRLACAIRNDAKTMANGSALPAIVGQLVIWDGSALLRTRREEISDAMRGLGEEWLLNVVSIAENRSYFLADCARARKKMTRLLGGRFADGVMSCRRLVLRKELLCLDAAFASSRRHRVAERPRQLLRLAG